MIKLPSKYRSLYPWTSAALSIRAASVEMVSEDSYLAKVPKKKGGGGSWWFGPQRVIYITRMKTRGTSWKRVQKNYGRAKISRALLQEDTFWTGHGFCVHGLTMSVYVRIVPNQVHQRFIMDGGGALEAPPLFDGILAVHGCWGRLQFSSTVQPLVHCLWSSKYPLSVLMQQQH